MPETILSKTAKSMVKFPLPGELCPSEYESCTVMTSTCSSWDLLPREDVPDTVASPRSKSRMVDFPSCLLSDQRRNWFWQCVSPYPEVQMEGRVRADLEFSGVIKGPGSHLSACSECQLCVPAFFYQLLEMAATVQPSHPDMAVLTFLGVEKPCWRQCPVPFMMTGTANIQSNHW